MLIYFKPALISKGFVQPSALMRPERRRGLGSLSNFGQQLKKKKKKKKKKGMCELANTVWVLLKAKVHCFDMRGESPRGYKKGAGRESAE
jgi:hypothetical protein